MPEPEAVETVEEPVEAALELPEDLDLGEGIETSEEPPAEPAPVEDPFAEFGGREAVANAHRIAQLASTDEGVVQLFIEAGRSLGLSFEQMEALFGQQQQQGEPEDLDRPITARELLERDQRLAQTQQQAQAQAQFQAAQTAMNSALAEVGLKLEDEATKLVLQFGDKHFDRQNPTAENVRAAVIRGHAEYTAFVDKQAREYISKKREKAAGVPKAPVGSAPSTPPAEEPKDAAEAARRVRALLGI